MNKAGKKATVRPRRDQRKAGSDHSNVSSRGVPRHRFGPGRSLTPRVKGPSGRKTIDTARGSNSIYDDIETNVKRPEFGDKPMQKLEINPDLHSLRLTCSPKLTHLLGKGLRLDHESKNLLQLILLGHEKLLTNVLRDLKFPLEYDVDRVKWIPGNMYSEMDYQIPELRVIYRFFVYEMIRGAYFLHRDSSGQTFRLNIQLSSDLRNLEIEALAAQIYEMPLKNIEEIEVNIRMMLCWEAASSEYLTSREEEAMENDSKAARLDKEMNSEIKTYWSTISFAGGVKIHLIFLELSDALRFSIALDILKTYVTANGDGIGDKDPKYPCNIDDEEVIEWLTQSIAEEDVAQYRPKGDGFFSFFVTDETEHERDVRINQELSDTDGALTLFDNRRRKQDGLSNYYPWSTEEWSWIKTSRKHKGGIVSCHKSTRYYFPEDYIVALNLNAVTEKERVNFEKKKLTIAKDYEKHQRRLMKAQLQQSEETSLTARQSHLTVASNSTKSQLTSKSTSRRPYETKEDKTVSKKGEKSATSSPRKDTNIKAAVVQLLSPDDISKETAPKEGGSSFTSSPRNSPRNSPKKRYPNACETDFS